MLEAVLGEFAASQFRIQVGDVLRLTPDLTLPKVISVPIVGIIEPTDPNADFWLPTPSLYLRPETPDPDDPGDGVYDPQIPPVPLITDMGMLVETVDATFPGTLSISIWTISLDKEVMKGWTPNRIRNSFREFETQFAMRMPGAAEVSSGFYRMLARFDARSFFARVPLLLLQTLMVATVLFFLVMMVAYLVRSRQADSALLSARGVTTGQIFRIYALEGLAMTIIAVIVAPFLAVGGVALAGVLPFFREMTNGDFLPLVVGPMPFLVAAITGLACLVVYAIPAAVGSRGGLLLHKLRSARPPSIPFVHRYYLDIGVPGRRRNHLLGTVQPGQDTVGWSLQERRGQRGTPFGPCHLLGGRRAPLPQGLPDFGAVYCGRVSDSFAYPACPCGRPAWGGDTVPGDPAGPL